MVRACDLKQREVINITNAERLGYVNDVDIEFETGKILSLIIPRNKGLFGLFSKRNNYIIPWDEIVAIGKEVVLVKTNVTEALK